MLNNHRFQAECHALPGGAPSARKDLGNQKVPSRRQQTHLVYGRLSRVFREEGIHLDVPRINRGSVSPYVPLPVWTPGLVVIARLSPITKKRELKPGFQRNLRFRPWVSRVKAERKE